MNAERKNLTGSNISTESREVVRQAFLLACKGKSFPAIADLHQFVGDFEHQQQGDLMVDLVEVHLREAWKRGQRIVLDDYVSEFGEQWLEFRSLVDLPDELIECEFVARHESHGHGDHPDVQNYVERFQGRQGIRSLLYARCHGQGRYVRLGLRGSGGVGRVTQAYDCHMQRYVAVKQLHIEFAYEVEYCRREAQITGRLNHPAIVPVFEHYENEGETPYYVMRLVGGRTLRERIKHFYEKKKWLPAHDRNVAWNRLLNAFDSVCEAVAYAHQQGVLHCDLKSSNIKLNEFYDKQRGDFDRPVLLDWGMAIELAPNKGVTKAASVDSQAYQGTLEYMSPEQAKGWLSKQTDIFSLGAVLYEMLTGFAPYESDREPSREEKLQVVKSGNYPSVKERKRFAAGALVEVCEKAMAIDCSKRYQSAAELADDIRRHLADENVSCEPRKSQVVRRLRKLQRYFWMVTLIVMSSFLVAWWYENLPKTGFANQETVGTVFQNFKDAQLTFLESVWADPRFEDSWIRAWRVREEPICKISFSRKGLGCDATFKSSTFQDGREQVREINVERTPYLVISVRADKDSLKVLMERGKRGLAFRVRVVDREGYQWAWGENRAESAQETIISFKNVDASGKPLELTDDREQRFVFDLSHRELWAFLSTHPQIFWHYRD